MQLELPVRWNSVDKENTRNKKMIEGDDAEEIFNYSYGKLLINSEDIGPYYDIDENNTMINDVLGKMYCVTIPVDQFKKIMTEVTGRAIMTIHVREDYPAQPKRVKPKKGPSNNDNDILM